MIALGKSKLSDTSVIAAPSGAVALTSNVKTNITSNADSHGRQAGAGIAVAVLVTSSEAFVDSTAATPVNGTSLTISADTDNTAPTTAKSSPKGTSENDEDVNDSSRADGNAKTSDDDIDLAAALAVSVLHSTTAAYIAPDDSSTHTVSTSTTQTIRAGSKHTTSATANGAPTSSSTGVGVAVAVEPRVPDDRRARRRSRDDDAERDEDHRRSR